jgi:ABC-type uncharacterized transport system permease subunit
MNDQVKWIESKIRMGWLLVIGGVVLAAVGLLLRWLVRDLPFNERIITALGILLLALGFAQLIKYRAARRDPETARRVTAEERDERMVMIRSRAGHRAFWVSLALTYAVLMWLSFSDSGSLPVLSQDALWYVMAAVVLVPMGVYIGSIMRDNARL